MITIDIDMDNLYGTTATDLSDLELSSLLPRYRFSTSEAVQEKMLNARIQEKLSDYERQLSVTEENLHELDMFISYLPYESNLRSDAEYRTKQIREIHQLKQELESWPNGLKAAAGNQSTDEQLQALRARIKACLNSPLKQYLLNTIEEKSTLVEVRQSSDTEPHSTPVTVEDIDNHLIGLMIPEYIDAETEIRLDVARRIYEEGQHIGTTDEELAAIARKYVEAHTATSLQPKTKDIDTQSDSTSILITPMTAGIEIVDGMIRLPERG